MIVVGDCREVMAGMEPDSVDAIVTDPPYGLEFMGKEWDKIESDSRDRGEKLEYSNTAWGSVFPNHRTGRNYRCNKCGRVKQGPPKYICSCVTPDFRRRGHEKGAQDWHESWAREAYRVLKPGGHLLAFGGSRTYHRMACAVEDAGFEIRDQIMWLYGSGFPKSLDVGKAIDKTAPRTGMFDGFALHFREQRKVSGLAQKEVAKHFPSKSGGLTGCVWNWENGANVPTLDQWAKLQPMLDLSDKWLPLIERVEAEREKIGESNNGLAPQWVANGNAGYGATFDITAPATALARQWDGWGTALKPGHEPVCWATKPLNVVPGECNLAETTLLLEALLWSMSPAKLVDALSPSSLSESGEESGSVRWIAAVLLGIESLGRSALTDTFSSPEGAATYLNIAQSWSATLAALSYRQSTSTTETESSLTIGLRTLNSWILASTPEPIIRAASHRGGVWWNASNAESDSSANGPGWSATPNVSAIEPVSWQIASGILAALADIAETSSLPLQVTTESTVPLVVTTSPAASPRPAHEPIVVARKPLIGTVAANVERYGTGAINIDACRVTGQRLDGILDEWESDENLCDSCAKDAVRTARRPTPVTRVSTVPSLAAPMRNGRGAHVRHDTIKADIGCSAGPNPVEPSSAPIAAGSSSTAVSGRITTDPFQMAGSSITSTATSSTTASTICISCGAAITSKPTTSSAPTHKAGRWPANILLDEAVAQEMGPPSRYFYCAKASRKERERGLNGDKCVHPTVKPVALMRWLVRLVTPPNGLVLDPFAGSGTTGIACALEGFEFVGIEQDSEYAEIAEKRIAAVEPTLFAEVTE